MRPSIQQACTSLIVCICAAASLAAATACAEPAPPAAPAITVPDYAIPNKLFEVHMPNYKGSKRLAVAGFRVGFTIRDKVTAQVAAGYQLGGTHTSGAKSVTAVALHGIDTSALQAVADQLYADFMARAGESGFEVIPLEQVKATAGFAKLETTPSSVEKPYLHKPKGVQEKFIMVMSPSALPLWWENGTMIGDKGPFDIANYKAMGEVSRELDAFVVAPTFVINFAELTGSGNKGGLFSGYEKGAKTGAKPRLGLARSDTRMFTVRGAKGGPANGHVTLKETVSLADYGAAMAKLADSAKGGNAALAGMSNASGDLSFFAAAGPAERAQMLAVSAQADQFIVHAVGVGRAANKVWVESLKKGKL
jgi:hypothetical protein